MAGLLDEELGRLINDRQQRLSYTKFFYSEYSVNFVRAHGLIQVTHNWHFLEPWSSGYGKRLMIKRSCVRIPVLDDYFFTFVFSKPLLMLEKNSKEKRLAMSLILITTQRAVLIPLLPTNF